MSDDDFSQRHSELLRERQQQQRESKLRDTKISRFTVPNTATGKKRTFNTSHKRQTQRTARRRLATTTGSRPLRVGANQTRPVVPLPPPPEERVITWRDVHLTHQQVVDEIRRERVQGESCMFYIYRPAEWWDWLYWSNPDDYYDQRYRVTIGVFCTVCKNRGEPYKCAGWDERELNEVNEQNRLKWVCPHCRKKPTKGLFD